MTVKAGWITTNNVTVPATIEVACGATAEFDTASEIGYRCTSCGAIVGSVGMPRVCIEAGEAQKMWQILENKKVPNDYS